MKNKQSNKRDYKRKFLNEFTDQSNRAGRRLANKTYLHCPECGARTKEVNLEKHLEDFHATQSWENEGGSID